jgi:hypothetical protein
MIEVTFLTPEDYKNPELFDSSTHDIRTVEFRFEDQEKVKQYIEYATN